MIYSPDTMPLTENTVMEVCQHEGLVRQAYRDSVGVWTWSVGLTDATGHKVRRYIDNPASLERCLSVFIWALDNYAEQVRDRIEHMSPAEHEFAAALSFHWNTGAIRRASWVRMWEAGDTSGSRRSFMAWRKPPGIVERREAERDLFFEGKWTNTGLMPEYTRLRRGYRPDWSSRQMIDVSHIIGPLVDAHNAEAA